MKNKRIILSILAVIVAVGAGMFIKQKKEDSYALGDVTIVTNKKDNYEYRTDNDVYKKVNIAWVDCNGYDKLEDMGNIAVDINALKQSKELRKIVNDLVKTQTVLFVGTSDTDSLSKILGHKLVKREIVNSKKDEVIPVDNTKFDLYRYTESLYDIDNNIAIEAQGYNVKDNKNDTYTIIDNLLEG